MNNCTFDQILGLVWLPIYNYYADQWPNATTTTTTDEDDGDDDEEAVSVWGASYRALYVELTTK